MVELPDLDYKQLDRLIAHKRRARTLSNGTIIPQNATAVNTAATFISDEGKTVVRQVRQEQKRLSEKEVAEIIIDYQGEKSANILAREYGCDRHTICDHLKKHGIKVTRNKIRSEEDVRNIIVLYEGGCFIEVIADQYDVSQATINRLLHKNGVRIRSRWDYER